MIACTHLTADEIGCPVCEPIAYGEPPVERVYIAGPMAGLPEFNYPAFREAAAKWRNAGWTVVDPTEHDHGTDHPAEFYMRLCIPAIATCDALAVLPGWANSRGARVEVRVALAMGLPIVRTDNGFAVSPVVLNAVGVIDHGIGRLVHATPGLAHALDLPNAQVPREPVGDRRYWESHTYPGGTR